VVMRTASFGHGLKGLEVCAGRKGFAASEELGEDFLIPLGLMAVLRRDMRERGEYEAGCQWYGGAI